MFKKTCLMNSNSPNNRWVSFKPDTNEETGLKGDRISAKCLNKSHYYVITSVTLLFFMFFTHDLCLLAFCHRLGLTVSTQLTIMAEKKLSRSVSECEGPPSL